MTALSDAQTRRGLCDDPCTCHSLGMGIGPRRLNREATRRRWSTPRHHTAAWRGCPARSPGEGYARLGPRVPCGPGAHAPAGRCQSPDLAAAATTPSWMIRARRHTCQNASMCPCEAMAASAGVGDWGAPPRRSRHEATVGAGDRGGLVSGPRGYPGPGGATALAGYDHRPRWDSGGDGESWRAATPGPHRPQSRVRTGGPGAPSGPVTRHPAAREAGPHYPAVTPTWYGTANGTLGEYNTRGRYGDQPRRSWCGSDAAPGRERPPCRASGRVATRCRGAVAPPRRSP